MGGKGRKKNRGMEGEMTKGREEERREDEHQWFFGYLPSKRSMSGLGEKKYF